MRKILFLHAALFAICLTSSHAQNTWTQKADFTGTGLESTTGFSIDHKGYVQSFENDLWEYDPDSDVWTQKADFAGMARTEAASFVIAGKGYIGTGWGADGSNYKDFWEYDPILNSWTQKADFGGIVRFAAVGFSIGDKGYLGTGNYYTDSANTELKDFWEYDPVLDQWTQKADFGGPKRWAAVGFSIGSKGYIGTGIDADVYGTSDFWEYDPAVDTWTQKADFGGGSRGSAVGFSIGSKGYIGTGGSYSLYNDFFNDFWEYNPDADTWTQKADFGGAARYSAIGFAIDSIGYLGLGVAVNDSGYDFWAYSPGVVEGIPSIDNAHSLLSLFPNPSNGAFVAYLNLSNEENNETTIEVLNLLGQKIYSQQEQLINGVLQKEIQLSGVTDGIYNARVIMNGEAYTKQLVISKQ